MTSRNIVQASLWRNITHNKTWRTVQHLLAVEASDFWGEVGDGAGLLHNCKDQFHFYLLFCLYFRVPIIANTLCYLMSEKNLHYCCRSCTVKQYMYIQHSQVRISEQLLPNEQILVPLSCNGRVCWSRLTPDTHQTLPRKQQPLVGMDSYFETSH